MGFVVFQSVHKKSTDMILRPMSYAVPFEMLPYMHLVSDAMPNRSPSWAVRRASTKRKQ